MNGDEMRDVLRRHHPIMRSETGPFSGCRCGEVRLGQDVIAHVLDALLPTVRGLIADELRAALKRVQAVYDLQCPAMTPEKYVGAGAYSAHQWWETVLGGALEDLRDRADGLAADTEPRP